MDSNNDENQQLHNHHLPGDTTTTNNDHNNNNNDNDNNSVGASFTDAEGIFMNDDDDNASNDSTHKIISDAIQEGFHNNDNENDDNDDDDNDKEEEEVYHDAVQHDSPGVDIVPNREDAVLLEAYLPTDPQRMMKLQRDNNKLSELSSSLLPSSALLQVPKRNRMQYFNTAGKVFRLTGKRSMDHMPILYKRNRCLLCYCETTVRCSTCQVMLCRNPFGTNTFSCFQKFHTEDILHPVNRNGATSKHNNKQEQPQQTTTTTEKKKRKAGPLPKKQDTTKSKKTKSVQTKQPDEHDKNHENNPEIKETDHIIENENKIVNESCIIDNTTNDNEATPTIIEIPKRNRMEFFNTTDGKRIRLTANNAMDHMPTIHKRTKCLLCLCETTVRCSTCQVQLCKYPFGTNTLSCFQMFHEKRVLKVIHRNGETHKQKVKVPNTEPMPPVDVPKRNRMDFYNNDGKKYRLAKQSFMDHMPVLFKRNRCLLCFCETTVRCGTCQVMLCRYPFGNNTLSCFQSFHSEEVLIFTDRNGETSKQHKEPKKIPATTTTTTTDNTPPSDPQQMDGTKCQDCTNSTKPIRIKTKDMKRREQLQHRRKYKVEAKVPSFEVPKRNRMDFFNKEGKKRRLSSTSAMDHLPIVYKRNRCLLCYCETTVRCSTCQVQLCKNAFGTNTLSCFQTFHTNDYIHFIERNGSHSKHKEKYVKEAAVTDGPVETIIQDDEKGQTVEVPLPDTQDEKGPMEGTIPLQKTHEHTEPKEDIVERSNILEEAVDVTLQHTNECNEQIAEAVGGFVLQNTTNDGENAVANI